MIRRADIEHREQVELAPYAARSAESRGRVYPQRPHPLRTEYQRDRDRIIHAAAFRRMEYKTQVFLPSVGDHFRTRLTHTIEVAQISRTLARNLQLNEDLTEAIALVHDVGHTPFGHAGEDVLNELLADSGGFNHNRQSLRVVDRLEQRYPNHPGLNLSYEVREGIAKHETKTPTKHPDFSDGLNPTLEASLVDIADEIAYNAHDIDDGVGSKLLQLDDLKSLAIWDAEKEVDGGGFERVSGSRLRLTGDQQRYAIVRYVVNAMATDLLNETAAQIEELSIQDMDSVRFASERVCRFSSAFAESVAELKEFLHRNLYRHERLNELSRRASEIIEALYRRFMADTSLLPARFQEMLLTEQQEIVIADYIAGMTDRYAEQKYEQLSG